MASGLWPIISAAVVALNSGQPPSIALDASTIEEETFERLEIAELRRLLAR